VLVLAQAHVAELIQQSVASDEEVAMLGNML
jgi:hypothetical protein